MGFGGLHGRGAKKQDPPIERDLYLSLEEVYHGCTKKMKISRRVKFIFLSPSFSLRTTTYLRVPWDKNFKLGGARIFTYSPINFTEKFI